MAAPDPVVLDASAMVEAMVRPPFARAVRRRATGCVLHAPAHFDAEILSVLGRLHRAGAVTARLVELQLGRLAAAPIQRHPLPPLLVGAWRRRTNLRLVDALYVELAEQLGATIITTDAGLAGATGRAELVDG